MRLNAGENLLFKEWFYDVVDGARLEGSDLLFGFMESDHEEHRDPTPAIIVFQTVARFKAIHAGHHDVEENEVRTYVFELSQGARTTVGDEHFVAYNCPRLPATLRYWPGYHRPEERWRSRASSSNG